MRRLIVLATALALAAGAAMPAFGQTVDEQEPVVSYHFDAEAGELTFGYGIGLDCETAPEDTTDAVDPAASDNEAFSDDDDVVSDDDAVSDDDDVSADDDDPGSDDDDAVSIGDADKDKADVEAIMIGECNTISVAGPNGQVNHGSAMAAVVHAIIASDLAGPRGHVIREFARSDIGKKDKSEKPDKGAKNESDKPGKGWKSDGEKPGNGPKEGKGPGKPKKG